MKIDISSSKTVIRPASEQADNRAGPEETINLLLDDSSRPVIESHRPFQTGFLPAQTNQEPPQGTSICSYAFDPWLRNSEKYPLQHPGSRLRVKTTESNVLPLILGRIS
jgi:hypothetical protein